MERQATEQMVARANETGRLAGKIDWLRAAGVVSLNQSKAAPRAPKENVMMRAFQVHMLNDAGKKNAADIAEAFDALAERLGNLCPGGREFAIVMTKLEEACFFAKKAMASHPDNQEAL